MGVPDGVGDQTPWPTIRPRLPAQGQPWTLERSRRLLAAQRSGYDRSVQIVPAPRPAPRPATRPVLRPGPPGVRGRRPGRLGGLDGLRALAVAAVVVFHANPGWLPGGFLGVDVFFVISGFLITRLLLTELAATGALDLVRFYRRRARRLLPALAVVVVTCVVMSALVWRDAFGAARVDAVAAALYVTNWWYLLRHQSYFQQIGRPSALTHLWSLGVEEQFYLLWPMALVLVAAAIRRRGRRGEGRRWEWRRGEAQRGIFGGGLTHGGPAGLTHGGTAGLTHGGTARLTRLDQTTVTRAVLVVATLGAGLSTAAMAWLAARGDVPFREESTRVYFGTDTHSMGLMTGAALAAATLLTGGRRRVPVALTDLLGVLGLVITGWFLVGTDEFSAGLYRFGFLELSLAATVLVGAATRPGSRLGRALDNPPMRWLGKRSYEVYLWHWPVFVVTRPGIDLSWSPIPTLLLRLAIVAALAGLTYRYVELPVRDGRLVAALTVARTAGRRRAAVVAAGATAMIVIASLPTAAASFAQRGLAGAYPSGVVLLPPGSAPEPAAPIGPAGPTAVASAGGREVSAFGDSVMLGAAGTLGQALPGIRVEATKGIRAYILLDQVRAALRVGALGQAVVIHTGNNGIVSGTDLDHLINALRGRLVILVNDRVDRNWERPNNRLFAAAARRYPGVSVLDWHTVSTTSRGWLYPDGLHLTDAGALAYASLVGQAVLSAERTRTTPRATAPSKAPQAAATRPARS
ncbi:MAG: acyltransferase family protein [Frankia sp.]